jgi:nitrous oxidase accessory protein NosD
MTIRHLFAVVLLGCGLLAHPHEAHAAQGTDNCVNFITSLPATLSTQGVWCLSKDLATNIASGNAITVAANNVTIDCNDFKVGGLAAGNGSNANGIYASNRQNITIRHCNVRGFSVGILLDGGAGHLAEDNRLDNNLVFGIAVYGDHNRVRRNAVYDTGGYAGGTRAFGIDAQADIEDNIVDGLFTDATTGVLFGIRAFSDYSQVSDNLVSGMAVNGNDPYLLIHGIQTQSFSTVADNHVAALVANTPGTGIYGTGPTRCIGNTVARFQAPLQCTAAASSHNLSH